MRPVLEYIDLVSSDDEEPSTSHSDVSTLYLICMSLLLSFKKHSLKRVIKSGVAVFSALQNGPSLLEWAMIGSPRSSCPEYLLLSVLFLRFQ